MTSPVLFILAVTALLVVALLTFIVNRRQEAILAEQAELLDLAHDAILVWDLRSGAIRFWNRGAEELYGWKKTEVLGRTPQAILNTQFPEPLARINEQLVRDRRWNGELVHSCRDGRSVVVASRWALQVDKHGNPRSVLGINTDVTNRKRMEEALEHQALHDPLTGLPNRTLFRDRLERALALAERHEHLAGVLFLDVDNFKLINDSLGHQAGDDLLVELGRRLQMCVRTSDTVARLGGDEFTVLLEEIDAEAEATTIAERIGEALTVPIRIADRDVIISASIGLAISSPWDTQPDNLLRNADIAMYQSKMDGKARHSVFDPGMQDKTLDRLELETALRDAVKLGQLRLHYQPIHSLDDGRLAEVEALVRWDRPGHGLLRPASFIAVAEETGLIVPIGQWVLEEACRQACAWNANRAPDAPLVVSVNLSARQFDDANLVTSIDQILQQTGMQPAALKLEITESAAIRDVDATVIKMQALKALGVQLAIDDFGTGYSSLTYLKRFPVDALKIDRSFIEGIGDNPLDTAIVHSVVALAKSLELSVVGEGVESNAQAVHLRAIGCHCAQGYLFAHPESAETITALLRDTTRATQRQAA